jgi:calcineurin-like phosphoesterase family protein
MRRWIIADTHFGHSNILKNCRRPADADARIIANWQRLVAPVDLVYHLGDVAWGFMSKGHQLLDLMNSLPGTKFLIKGNHDTRSIEHYLRNGFSAVCSGMCSSGVFLSHAPQKVIPDGCGMNVHGHLHNTKPQDYRTYPHCRLFALEYENYEPRLFEKFCRLKKERNN